MKNQLVNEDCSINIEALEKILTVAKTSDRYNPNAKEVFKKLLAEKNRNKNNQNN